MFLFRNPSCIIQLVLERVAMEDEFRLQEDKYLELL